MTFTVYANTFSLTHNLSIYFLIAVQNKNMLLQLAIYIEYNELKLNKYVILSKG